MLDLGRLGRKGSEMTLLAIWEIHFSTLSGVTSVFSTLRFLTATGFITYTVEGVEGFATALAGCWITYICWFVFLLTDSDTPSLEASPELWRVSTISLSWGECASLGLYSSSDT